jgi:hypothetical protein
MGSQVSHGSSGDSRSGVIGSWNQNQSPPSYTQGEEPAGGYVGAMWENLKKTQTPIPGYENKERTSTVVNPPPGGTSPTGDYQKYFTAAEENRKRLYEGYTGQNLMQMGQAIVDMQKLSEAYNRDAGFIESGMAEMLTATTTSDYMDGLNRLASVAANLSKGGGGGTPDWYYQGLLDQGVRGNELKAQELQNNREAEKQRLLQQLADSQATLTGSLSNSYVNASQNAIMPGQEYMMGEEPGGIMENIARLSGREYTPQRLQGTRFSPNEIMNSYLNSELVRGLVNNARTP